jgi:hypothetical protein
MLFRELFATASAAPSETCLPALRADKHSFPNTSRDQLKMITEAVATNALGHTAERTDLLEGSRGRGSSRRNLRCLKFNARQTRTCRTNHHNVSAPAASVSANRIPSRSALRR